MKEKSLGFIGGGRVARIILGGLKKAGQTPAKIIASDTNPEVLKKLQSGFPSVHIVPNNNREAAVQDLVFLGLHPPAIAGSLTVSWGGGSSLTLGRTSSTGGLASGRARGRRPVTSRTLTLPLTAGAR